MKTRLRLYSILSLNGLALLVVVFWFRSLLIASETIQYGWSNEGKLLKVASKHGELQMHYQWSLEAGQVYGAEVFGTARGWKYDSGPIWRPEAAFRWFEYDQRRTKRPASNTRGAIDDGFVSLSLPYWFLSMLLLLPAAVLWKRGSGQRDSVGFPMAPTPGSGAGSGTPQGL